MSAGTSPHARAWWQYYWRLVTEAHSLAKGQWGHLTTWGGYALAVALWHPVFAEYWKGIHVHARAVAGPAVFALIFLATLSVANWRTVRALQARRTFRVRLLSKHWELAQQAVFVVEITNASDEPTTLERDWYFDLIAEDGKPQARFMGRARRHLGTLQPHQRVEIDLVFGNFGVVEWIGHQAVGRLTATDIYGNTAQDLLARSNDLPLSD